MDSEEELPTVEQIHTIHLEIEEQYDLKYRGTRGFFPDRKIRSVIERASQRETPYAKAAVLLKGIKQIHVFEDGNKRTAWMAAVDYLDRNDFEPAPGGVEAEIVMKRIDRFEAEEIAVWLETGEIDEERMG